MKIRSAFTMLELSFVIAVIGILAAIAIPKFAGTRNDATISKAKSTVAAVRNAIATERNKRILKGNFATFTSLGGTTGTNKILFDYFDGDASGSRVLEYGIRSCKTSSSEGCWIKVSNTEYDYKMPVSGTAVKFIFDGKSRFDCSGDSAHAAECRKLTE
jgi:general secretion pathway protein G